VRAEEQEFLTGEESERLVAALVGQEYELPMLIGLYCWAADHVVPRVAAAARGPGGRGAARLARTCTAAVRTSCASIRGM